MNPIQLLTSQTIVSTKNFQSKFASMVKQAQENQKYYSITRSGESVGVFIPQEMWESLLEDIQALSSPNYLRSIKEARQEFERGEHHSMEDVFSE